MRIIALTIFQSMFAILAAFLLFYLAWPYASAIRLFAAVLGLLFGLFLTGFIFVPHPNRASRDVSLAFIGFLAVCTLVIVAYLVGPKRAISLLHNRNVVAISELFLRVDAALANGNVDHASRDLALAPTTIAALPKSLQRDYHDRLEEFKGMIVSDLSGMSNVVCEAAEALRRHDTIGAGAIIQSGFARHPRINPLLDSFLHAVGALRTGDRIAALSKSQSALNKLPSAVSSCEPMWAAAFASQLELYDSRLGELLAAYATNTTPAAAPSSNFGERKAIVVNPGTATVNWEMMSSLGTRRWTPYVTNVYLVEVGEVITGHAIAKIYRVRKNREGAIVGEREFVRDQATTFGESHVRIVALPEAVLLGTFRFDSRDPIGVVKKTLLEAQRGSLGKK